MADEPTDLKVDISNLGDAVAPNGHDKDAPTVEIVEAAPDPKPEPKAKRQDLSPEEGIQKLQRQLEEERALREQESARREDAERRAAEASAGEVQAKTEAQQSQLDMVSNAIANLTSANDLLTQKYADALAAQDYAAAAAAQREMSKNEAKLVQLESGKSNMERAGKPTPRPIESADPVERFVKNMTPKSAAWVRAHPEFVRDPKKNRKMLAAHDLAMADYAPESDEYFESIERTLGVTQSAQPDPDPADDPLTDAAKPTGRRTPPPAAPPSRSGTGRGGNSNIVTLTAAEVEIAEMNGMTPKEYALQKQRIAREKERGLN
jgi:hypothetical protein